jgi:hypothetical protein
MKFTLIDEERTQFPISFAASHTIEKEVEHQLRHHLKFLSGAIIHVDPSTEAGEAQHRSAPHQHDGLEMLAAR